MRGINKVTYLAIFLGLLGLIVALRNSNAFALQIDTEEWGTKYSKNVYYFGNKNINGKTYLEVSPNLSGASKEQVLFCEDAIIGGFDSENYSLEGLDATAQQVIKVDLIYKSGSKPLCASLIYIGADWNVSSDKPVVDIDIEPSIIWIWNRQPTLKITGTLIKGSSADANLKYYVYANESVVDSISIDFANDNRPKVLAKGSMNITNGKTVTELVDVSGPVDYASFSFHDRFDNETGGTSVEYHNYGLFRSTKNIPVNYIYYGIASVMVVFLIYKRSVKNRNASKSLTKKNK